MSESNQIRGVNVYADVELQIHPTHRAARVGLRPTEIGVFGSYRAAFNSGSMAAGLAGASPIFECRWASTAAIMLLRRLTLMAYVAGTGFTAGQALFNLFR